MMWSAGGMSDFGGHYLGHKNIDTDGLTVQCSAMTDINWEHKEMLTLTLTTEIFGQRICQSTDIVHVKFNALNVEGACVLKV